MTKQESERGSRPESAPSGAQEGDGPTRPAGRFLALFVLAFLGILVLGLLACGAGPSA